MILNEDFVRPPRQILRRKVVPAKTGHLPVTTSKAGADRRARSYATTTSSRGRKASTVLPSLNISSPVPEFHSVRRI